MSTANSYTPAKKASREVANLIKKNNTYPQSSQGGILVCHLVTQAQILAGEKRFITFLFSFRLEFVWLH